MPATKPPFQFWSFFFSLKGRVSRMAYALAAAGPQILLVGSIWLFFLWAGALDYRGHALGRAMIFFARVVWLWPTFAITSKRLHDIGWSSWPAACLALPIFIPIVITIVQMMHPVSPLSTPSSPEIAFTNFAFLVLDVTTYGVMLAGVALALVPGRRGPNRYGPAPLRHDTAPDVF